LFLEAKAGGIVFRLEAETARYLLVQSKSHPDRWIFPKGHVNQGERASDAAIREVTEEAGVETQMIGFVGAVTLLARWRIIRTKYFLLEFSREVGSTEGRESRWCTYDEARGLVSFRGAQALLRRARTLVQRKLSSQ
jgi:bis(5'-nucleosidyl)-tetraphosphatase